MSTAARSFDLSPDAIDATRPRVAGGILIAEPVPGWSAPIASALDDRGFPVATVLGYEHAVRAMDDTVPLLVIVTGHGHVDQALDACRAVRRVSEVPVLVVADDPDEALEVAALDAGGDDVVRSSIGADALAARIRAVARRAVAPTRWTPSTVGVGDLVIDLDHRVVTRAGARVALSPLESGLLFELAARPGRLLSQRRLLAAVWGLEARDRVHYLHVYMARLRAKIEPDPSSPRYLVAERGRGYRLLASILDVPADGLSRRRGGTARR